MPHDEASWDQVIAFRLERQFLRSRAPAGSLFEVASALCGVRAQLPLTAELALWARVDGLAQGEVKQALEDERTLVKTWIRNTLNVVPADDLALYVAVLRPRPEGPGDAWLRLRGVTREQYEAIVKNVPRALDGRPQTREWLADRLAELAGPDVREAVLFSWGGVLKQSARFGDLCFGPPRGRNVTFVRPDRWLRRTLRADPVGSSESIFRTETRVATTDVTARKRFRWYWARFSAGIVLIRRLMLWNLKREAERRARAAEPAAATVYDVTRSK